MASRDAMIKIQFDESAFDKYHNVLTGILRVKIEERNYNKDELLLAIARDAREKAIEVCKASSCPKDTYPRVMTALYLKSREKIYLSSSERCRSGASSKMIPQLISKLNFNLSYVHNTWLN